MCHIKCDQLINLTALEASLSTLVIVTSLTATGSLVSVIGIGILIAAPFTAATLTGVGAYILVHNEIVPLHYAHFIVAAAEILIFTAFIITALAFNFLSIPLFICLAVSAAVPIAYHIIDGILIQNIDEKTSKAESLKRQIIADQGYTLELGEEAKATYAELVKTYDGMIKKNDLEIQAQRKRLRTHKGPEEQRILAQLIEKERDLRESRKQFSLLAQRHLETSETLYAGAQII